MLKHIDAADDISAALVQIIQAGSKTAFVVAVIGDASAIHVLCQIDDHGCEHLACRTTVWIVMQLSLHF